MTAAEIAGTGTAANENNCDAAAVDEIALDVGERIRFGTPIVRVERVVEKQTVIVKYKSQ